MNGAGVLGLHHAGVYVADVERSISFYADVFGLEVAERLDFGGEKLAFLRVGTVRLELIEPIQGSSVRVQQGVVDHVALEVRDLNELLARLRQRGVTLIDPDPIEIHSLGARIAFCLGPDGERIELFETCSS
jgi:catechol 2,3-dioxygenase-like lactoylglutathione lyase family enzyme